MSLNDWLDMVDDTGLDTLDFTWMDSFEYGVGYWIVPDEQVASPPEPVTTETPPAPPQEIKIADTYDPDAPIEVKRAVGVANFRSAFSGDQP